MKVAATYSRRHGVVTNGESRLVGTVGSVLDRWFYFRTDGAEKALTLFIADWDFAPDPEPVELPTTNGSIVEYPSGGGGKVRAVLMYGDTWYGVEQGSAVYRQVRENAEKGTLVVLFDAGKVDS